MQTKDDLARECNVLMTRIYNCLKSFGDECRRLPESSPELRASIGKHIDEFVTLRAVDSAEFIENAAAFRDRKVRESNQA